jgi:hypothetical protein
MKTCYISTLDKIDEQYHRSHVILHKDYQWHFGDFDNMEQLQFLADTLGFEFELVEEKAWPAGGTYRKYAMNRKIDSPCSGGFWKREDVPAEAKPIKALSNGSIVTCYFTNDGETIRFYRPNPNAKGVYKPLELSEHIAHCKTYGTY